MDKLQARSGVMARPTGWGQRHTLALFGFWAFSCSYAMRFNLSLAIVAMVRHNTHSENNGNSDNKTSSETCSELHTGTQGADPLDDSQAEFDWTEAEQGFILGSFFWGYVLTQIPGGILSQKYGGKWVCGLGLLVTAVLSLAIPVAARLGKEYLIFIRILQGLGEGVTVPAMQVILSKWLPPDERSRLATLVYSGISIGTALTMIVTGYLISFFGSWTAVFYGIGIISLVWFIAWTYFVYDTPESHPRISEIETEYINNAIGDQGSNEKLGTPWKKIITCRPVIAIFVAQVSNAWGLYTLLTELPTYMRTVMNFDIKENSWVSASPHLCMFIIATVVTHIADIFIEKKWASRIFMRKACNSIAQWGTAIALVAAAYSGCNRLLTVVLLNLAVGQMGAGFGGFLVNSIDIAPSFAGVIMGIGNAFANLCGFAAPYLAGEIISGNPSIEQWRLVFMIAAGVLFFGNLFYVCFASGEEMEWNRQTPPEVYISRPKMRRFSAVSESIQLNVN